MEPNVKLSHPERTTEEWVVIFWRNSAGKLRLASG